MLVGEIKFILHVERIPLFFCCAQRKKKPVSAEARAGFQEQTTVILLAVSAQHAVLLSS